jgi:hypothetical protein
LRTSLKDKTEDLAYGDDNDDEEKEVVVMQKCLQNFTESTSMPCCLQVYMYDTVMMGRS